MRSTVQIIAFAGILVAAAFSFWWIQDQYSGAASMRALAQSHIDANVPPDSTFDTLLRRDLTKYFEPSVGGDLEIEYELLRRGATQTGISYPKFYLWVMARRDGKLLKDGYARVQAVDRTGFDVTHFIPRGAVDEDSALVYSIFPAAVAGEIMRRQRQ